jgi:hypothetical protein
MDDWTMYRLTDAALAELAGEAVEGGSDSAR